MDTVVKVENVKKTDRKGRADIENNMNSRIITNKEMMRYAHDLNTKASVGISEKGIITKFDGLSYPLLAFPTSQQVNNLLPLKRAISSIVQSSANYFKQLLPHDKDGNVILSPFGRELVKAFDYLISWETNEKMKAKLEAFKWVILAILEIDTSYRWRAQFLIEKVLSGEAGINLENLKLQPEDKYFFSMKADHYYGERDPEGQEYRKKAYEDLERLRKEVKK